MHSVVPAVHLRLRFDLQLISDEQRYRRPTRVTGAGSTAAWPGIYTAALGLRLSRTGVIRAACGIVFGRRSSISPEA